MAERTVLITGAAGGLGSTVTRRWLESGANVLAVDATEAALGRLTPHPSLRTLATDVTSEEGCARMIATAFEQFGDLDSIIHLVGGFAMGGIDAPDAVDNWNRMVLLNMHTTFHVFRAATPVLKARGGGWLLAIGSKAAHTTPGSMTAYAATKAGVIAFVKSLSEELKADGIHVNAVLPSTIDTPANRAAMGDAAAAKWVTGDDIAEATLFLCSPKAKAIFGTELDVYGLS